MHSLDVNVMVLERIPLYDCALTLMSGSLNGKMVQGTLWLGEDVEAVVVQ
jgi:hypothetical protein